MPRRAELPNLLPARLDLTHYRGDSISMRVRLRHQGRPIDIAGWGLRAEIRPAPDSTALTEFQIIHLGGVGEVRLFLSHVQTQDLPPTCAWDLQVSREVTSIVNVQTIGFTHVRTLVRGFIYSPADITVQRVAAPPSGETVRR